MRRLATLAVTAAATAATLVSGGATAQSSPIEMSNKPKVIYFVDSQGGGVHLREFGTGKSIGGMPNGQRFTVKCQFYEPVDGNFWLAAYSPYNGTDVVVAFQSVNGDVQTEPTTLEHRAPFCQSAKPW